MNEKKLQKRLRDCVCLCVCVRHKQVHVSNFPRPHPNCKKTHHSRFRLNVYRCAFPCDGRGNICFVQTLVFSLELSIKIAFPLPVHGQVDQRAFRSAAGSAWCEGRELARDGGLSARERYRSQKVMS